MVCAKTFRVTFPGMTRIMNRPGQYLLLFTPLLFISSKFAYETYFDDSTWVMDLAGIEGKEEEEIIQQQLPSSHPKESVVVFFVEAGALDGQQLSNTLWLEQELDWTGLLIEPNPYSFHHLQHKHRKAWTSNSCISTNKFTRRSTFASSEIAKGSATPWFAKGSTYQLGVTMKTSDGLEGNDGPLDEGGKYFFMVHCFPLHSYLLALNVTTIDMLSLDTQGSEVDILKSIPWEKVNIRVLVIEVTDLAHFQTDLVEYLKGKGFVLVGNFLDYVFVKKGDSAYSRLLSHGDWYIEAREDKGNIIFTHFYSKQIQSENNDK
ncbi:hypothetical protein Pcinc_037516 [Petrolisthes cinctipes]|uniref:Methyltransferase FkbM domain-containing protein n=1 Tax=Petrolisthes cinctipes TaxID=88211 RepID=A0AAE1BWD3_PETCI|nr:hypothetical protein Pcinc_037516 [Petrolisthes cinctipes]